MNKNLLFVLALIIIAAFAVNKATAQNPAYNLSAKNFQFLDSLGDGIDAMTFDIFIEHTNLAASGPFEFALGQYYFNVSSAVGVTADYTYFIVPGSTQFTNPNALPRSPTFVSPDATSPLGASLRANSNTVLGAGSGPIVSPSFPGTRICTMKFKKKVGSFPDTTFSMVWRKALPNPFSKIFAYIGSSNTDISNSVPGVNQAKVELNSLPVLKNPLNNSINNPTIIDFSWNKVSNAVRYQIQIATDSLFNNVFYTDQYVYDTTITLGSFNYATKYYWKIYSYDVNNISYNSAVWNFKIQEIPALKLKITALVEGMYYPLFNQLSRRDSVKAELRQVVSPYNIIATSNNVLDSLSYSSYFSFPFASPGTYYIVYKHFNSLDTWSKSGGETFNYTDTVNYNFTFAASQAYGNNLKLKGSKYCIISGDVDRDGYIDASDASSIDNDSYISRTGRFLPTDLNGDNFVDADDMNIQDNNRNRGLIQP